MRIHCILLFLMLMLCFCSACSNVIPISKEYQEITNEELLNDRDTFRYITLKELEPTNNLRYKYQLLNNEGKVIFEDTTFRLPPKFYFISENIIRIRISAGTGVYFDKFYDILNEKISDYFYAPYAIFENYVISVQYIQEENDTFLIVQDMFIKNETYLYQKIDIAYSTSPDVHIKSIKILVKNTIYIQYESKKILKSRKKYFVFRLILATSSL